MWDDANGQLGPSLVQVLIKFKMALFDFRLWRIWNASQGKGRALILAQSSNSLGSGLSSGSSSGSSSSSSASSTSTSTSTSTSSSRAMWWWYNLEGGWQPRAGVNACHLSMPVWWGETKQGCFSCLSVHVAWWVGEAFLSPLSRSSLFRNLTLHWAILGSVSCVAVSTSIDFLAAAFSSFSK